MRAFYCQNDDNDDDDDSIKFGTMDVESAGGARGGEVGETEGEREREQCDQT